MSNIVNFQPEQSNGDTIIRSVTAGETLSAGDVVKAVDGKAFINRDYAPGRSPWEISSVRGPVILYDGEYIITYIEALSGSQYTGRVDVCGFDKSNTIYSICCVVIDPSTIHPLRFPHLFKTNKPYTYVLVLGTGQYCYAWVIVYDATAKQITWHGPTLIQGENNTIFTDVCQIDAQSIAYSSPDALDADALFVVSSGGYVSGGSVGYITPFKVCGTAITLGGEFKWTGTEGCGSALCPVQSTQKSTMKFLVGAEEYSDGAASNQHVVLMDVDSNLVCSKLSDVEIGARNSFCFVDGDEFLSCSFCAVMSPNYFAVACDKDYTCVVLEGTDNSILGMVFPLTALQSSLVVYSVPPSMQYMDDLGRLLMLYKDGSGGNASLVTFTINKSSMTFNGYEPMGSNENGFSDLIVVDSAKHMFMATSNVAAYGGVFVHEFVLNGLCWMDSSNLLYSSFFYTGNIGPGSYSRTNVLHMQDISDSMSNFLIYFRDDTHGNSFVSIMTCIDDVPQGGYNNNFGVVLDDCNVGLSAKILCKGSTKCGFELQQGAYYYNRKGTLTEFTYNSGVNAQVLTFGGSNQLNEDVESAKKRSYAVALNSHELMILEPFNKRGCEY